MTKCPDCGVWLELVQFSDYGDEAYFFCWQCSKRIIVPIETKKVEPKPSASTGVHRWEDFDRTT